MAQDLDQERLGEQLSALIDDELARDERAFLLRRLEREPEARARLARYYLMRDALQRTLPPQLDTALVERVHQQLAEEPPHERRWTGRSERRWPVLGSALAATVAAVTVLWWQSQPGDPPERAPGVDAIQPVESAGDRSREREPLDPAGRAARPVTLGDGSLPWPTGGPVPPGQPGTAGPGAAEPPRQDPQPQLRRYLIDRVDQAEPGYSGNALRDVGVPPREER